MRQTLCLLRRLAIPVLAVLGSTITVNPILAAEPNEELKAIRDVLNKIDQRLETQNTLSLQMVDRLKLDFGQLKSDLMQLRDEIALARRELADLKGRGTGGNSTSYFGGSTSFSPAATASIRLVNTYLTDMTAIINGGYYVVRPGQSQTVSVSSGPVNYQVLQTQPAAKTTSLQPGEVLTLSLYPRW